MTFPRSIVLLGLAGLLSACSGTKVKDTLGLSRKPPDEFRVVSRPPLSVPPQFNLRPPATAAEAPATPSADKQAESLVLGNAPEEAEKSNTFSLKEGASETAVAPVEIKPLGIVAKTSAESQFLQNIGADKADSSVRDKLIEERMASQEAGEEEDDSWWDSIISKEKKDPLVNAKEEAERIKQNKEAGKPVTEGETPEVKQKDTGVLGRILGY